ncbi:hypothetical protein ACH4N4_30480 [Streptomyces microflavus]|uniref:DUF7167 family protein n=1 Tax=Streptomyces microflavus TaxID=1919 RepID=UPI003787C7E6
MKRIVVHVAMTAISSSTQELVLTGDDIPEGWDQMTDDQKSAAMQPIVQAHIDNEIDAGWGEYND